MDPRVEPRYAPDVLRLPLSGVLAVFIRSRAAGLVIFPADAPAGEAQECAAWT